MQYYCRETLVSMCSAFHRWRRSESWGWVAWWENKLKQSDRNPSKCICWWWCILLYSCGQLNLSMFVPCRAIGMSMAHNPIRNNTGAKNAAVGGHMNRFLSKQWEDYHRNLRFIHHVAPKRYLLCILHTFMVVFSSRWIPYAKIWWITIWKGGSISPLCNYSADCY